MVIGDCHLDAILGWIAAKDDITIAKIKEKLAVERGATVGVVRQGKGRTIQ